MYVKVTGPYGLFARPELRAERYSYEMITPSAAQGLLKAVYWKPQIEYRINRIICYKEPEYELIKTNDSMFKPTAKQVCSGKSLATGGSSTTTMRTMAVLRNPEFVIDFSIVLREENETSTYEKHSSILVRRLKHGQFHHQPCLGAKEFSATVEFIDEPPKSPLKGVRDMGLMFHHYIYEKAIPEPVFFHAVMRNGIVDARGEERETAPVLHGWLFQDLVRQYRRRAEEYDLPTFGYSQENITFEAVLSREGKLVEFNPIAYDKKDKPASARMVVPEMVKGRTSSIRANFLWDVPTYALGWPGKNDEDIGNRTEAEKKFAAFGAKLKEILQDDCPESHAMLKYAEKMPDLDLALPYEKEMELSRKTVFRLEGKETYIHENPKIKKAWESYYNDHLEGKRGRCMVTGETDILAEQHPFITGVRGSKMNNAKLVSIDRNNGKSYECYGAHNCLTESTPMGMHTAFEYAAMLNYYLADPAHRLVIGDTTFVFWSDHDTEPLIRKIRNMIRPDGEEIDIHEASDERFYILALEPNAANGIRLGVRYYKSFHDRDGEIVDFISWMDSYVGYQKHNWKLIKGEETMAESQGYLLGQLFAVLDKAQRNAVPSTKRNRSSIAYRYMTAARNSPASCMAILVTNSYNHTRKCDYGLGKLRRELVGKLSGYEEMYPEKLPVQEQGMFSAGYEAMMERLYTKKSKEEVKEDE